MTKYPEQVRLTDEQYKALGAEVCQVITAAEDARDAISPRWKQVTSYYNNEPLRESWKWLKRYKHQHFPLSQPKIDQLCAILTTSLFSQERTLLARQTVGDARVQPLEDLVQFFLDQGFETVVDEMAPVACNTNHAAIYVPFEVRDARYGREPAGFGFYGIAPGDFVVAPTYVRSLDEAILVGHKKTMTFGQVEYFQKLGKYRKCAVTPGQTPAHYESGMGNEQRTDSESAIPSHQPVRIDVVVYETTLPGQKMPKRYQLIVAFDTQEILRVDEYPFKYCRYIDLRVKPRQYGGYWSMTSVGQDLQSLQWMYNQLSNLLVAGQWIKAFPYFVTDGRVDKSQEIVPMSGVQVTGSTTFPQITFNPGEIPFMLQQIKADADAVTRVTQESTGSSISKRQTLGEMQMRQAGASQGLKKFLSAFGDQIAQIGYTIQEQLYFHYDIWASIYPEQAASLGDPEVLKAYLHWEAAGKTPDTNSQEVLEKLMVIEQMAEKDIQESMMLGFDPTFDIGDVRTNIANTIRPPNVKDLFFDPERPSAAMQGIIAGTIQQKAQEMAVQMAEQMVQQAEGDQQMQMAQQEEMHEMDMHSEKMDHEREKQMSQLKADEKDMKHETALHKMKMQLEQMKQRMAAQQAKKKPTNGSK